MLGKCSARYISLVPWSFFILMPLRSFATGKISLLITLRYVHSDYIVNIKWKNEMNLTLVMMYGPALLLRIAPLPARSKVTDAPFHGLTFVLCTAAVQRKENQISMFTHGINLDANT